MDFFLTWSIKRIVDFIAKKLDRFLINDSWIDVFPDLRASFSPPDFSDHCVGVLYAVRQLRKHGNFKFFNYLIKNANFLSTVAQSWSICTL